MAVPFAPRFSYGPTPTIINMKHTTVLGLPARKFVGGGSESGAGVPETFTIRKEGLWNFDLRVDETEWPTILTMLEWIIESGSLGVFNFYPDQNNLTAHGAPLNCYLVKPQGGMDIEPTRLGGYAAILVIPMSIKTVSRAAFDVRILAP